MWESLEEEVSRGLFRLFCFVCGLVLVFLLLTPLVIYGQTQLSSQSKPQSSSSSSKHLETWENLSTQFDLLLKTHEETLTKLEVKLRTSENSLEQSTLLLETLSTQNDSLKNYNQQIGERMQERDEDLAAAYAEIARLEKIRWRLVIACAFLGSLLVLGAVLRCVRVV